MTDTDKTIPVWVDNEGEKVQVGWATPDNGGVRKINLLEGFENTSLKNVKFGDVESFETTLDPDETQEPPRTFQEFASEPFVDVDGEVLAPALDETPGFVDTTPEPVEEPTFQEPEVEVTPEAPAPVENAPEEAPLPSEPIEDAPDEELEAQPIDAGVAPEDTEPVVEATIEPDDTDDEEGFIDTEGDLPYIHDEDLENVDDDDSDETEDLPEGFEPAPAVQDEPTQDEDPAQP